MFAAYQDTAIMVQSPTKCKNKLNSQSSAHNFIKKKSSLKTLGQLYNKNAI